jgi:hypothetical protein
VATRSTQMCRDLFCTSYMQGHGALQEWNWRVRYKMQAGCVTRSMHERSIAMSIIETVREEAERRGVQVTAVHLRLGALSGVVKDALFFSCKMASQDTPLTGSRS